ncbi:MAG: pentapeptide repeat-containing protein [Mucilaginibacter sp.]|nr:pentapeptide repeat-containing protein [Mucilaginibacter sp.]
MERIEIKEDCKVVIANKAMLNDSYFNDVAMMNVKIINANLSDLEIEGAQLGGAYIHNIGMPSQGHPMYNAEARQRPLRFEDCDFHNSTLTNCDLSGVAISNCNTAGMQVNGILLEDLLNEYKKVKR